jgi:hypothetical protein
MFVCTGHDVIRGYDVCVLVFRFSYKLIQKLVRSPRLPTSRLSFAACMLACDMSLLATRTQRF